MRCVSTQLKLEALLFGISCGESEIIASEVKGSGAGLCLGLSAVLVE